MSKLFQKLKKERERLGKEAENRGNFEKVPWWKPDKGDNLVRILPDTKNPDEELPFRQIATHFIGIEKDDGSTVKIGVRCLREFEEDCPVCDVYDKLVKVDKNKAGDLRARTAYLYNIIDYKTRSVHPWSAGVTVHEQVMGFAEDYTDNIFSTAQGRDWKIVKKVDPRKSSKFGISYSVRPSVKDTALPPKLAPLLESVVDLDTLYQAKEREKMIAWLESDEELAEYLAASAPSKKAKGKVEEEETEEVDFDDLDETPKATAAAKAKAAAAKAKSKASEEDDDDDSPSADSFGDFDEDADEAPPKKSAKAAAPAAKGKPAAKAKPKDDDDEDLGVGDDEELEDELRELGVM